jgi:ribosomal protein L35
MRRHASGNHFLEKKSASRKRTFSGTESLSGKQVKSVRRNLGA